LFIAEHKEEYKKILYIKLLRDKCNSLHQEFMNELNNELAILDKAVGFVRQGIVTRCKPYMRRCIVIPIFIAAPRINANTGPLTEPPPFHLEEEAQPPPHRRSERAEPRNL
jgi:hypothetical protein